MSEALIIRVEDGSGRQFVTGTSDDTILVGRSPMADLRLVSAAVSAVHVKLLIGQRVIRAQDLGSKNGTFLDDRQLPAQQLVEVPSGSVLDIGATFRLTFSWGELPAARENPFEEGEVEDDDGTARLHPAALLALREKLEKRQALARSAAAPSHEPEVLRVPPSISQEARAAHSPLSVTNGPSPQPPSLDLPWTSREVTGGAAALPSPARPTLPPPQTVEPVHTGRGRITLAGTADAATLGADQTPHEPGSATVARVRIGSVPSVAPAGPVTTTPTGSAPSSSTPPPRAPTVAPSPIAAGTPSRLSSFPVASPLSAATGSPLAPLGELRVRLSNGEELRTTHPSHPEDRYDAPISRRPVTSRRTADRRASPANPRRTGNGHVVDHRRGRSRRGPVIAAAAIAVVGALVWLTLHLVTSSNDSPPPRGHHESEAR